MHGRRSQPMKNLPGRDQGFCPDVNQPNQPAGAEVQRFSLENLINSYAFYRCSNRGTTPRRSHRRWLDVELTGFAPADCARPGDLTFAEKEAYFVCCRSQAQAAAIFVSGPFTSARKSSSGCPMPVSPWPECCPLFFPPDESASRHSSEREPSRLRRKLIPRHTSGRIV